MKKTIVTLVPCLAFSLSAIAQDHPDFRPKDIRGTGSSSVRLAKQTTATGSYFPLARGNVWRYLQDDGWCYGTSRYIRVYDTLSGNPYPRWLMDTPRPFGAFDIDTVTLNDGDTLLWHRQGSDEILYKFNTTVGDTWSYPQLVITWERRIVQYLGEIDSLRVPCGPLANVWFRNVKVYFSDVPGYFDVSEVSYFAPGIGLVFRIWYPLMWILYGAVIDGYLYGDTSIVSVTERENQSLPTQLFQNHPNPFNAETNILYSVSTFEHVTLRVYDVLGREIDKIVDEKRPPGVYRVSWNAKNYPSGVYFYELRVGSQFQRKKMILLR